VLSVEDKELGIAAGLQDRVVQAYGKPVYMDFNKEIMQKQGYGYYEIIDASLFPDMYIAFHKSLSEGTEVLHNNLRARFNIGEKEVLKAMEKWSGYTEKFLEALKKHDCKIMHDLINANFDLRASLIKITKGNIEMVKAARSVGASAKFTGSGGAIIGTYANENIYQKLIKTLAEKNIEVIKPNIVNS
jgi:glucuronokinase